VYNWSDTGATDTERIFGRIPILGVDIRVGSYTYITHCPCTGIGAIVWDVTDEFTGLNISVLSSALIVRVMTRSINTVIDSQIIFHSKYISFVMGGYSVKYS
jgi:hypothetical protein